MAQKDEDIEEQPQRVQKFQPPAFPRPILSTQDTFDQNTQVENFTEAFVADRRPLWNVPNIVASSEKVITSKASASVNTVSQAIATAVGIANAPSTNSVAFSVLANMVQVIKANGPVQVNFAVNAFTQSVSDPGKFAVFRDGLQISQIFVGSSATANHAFNVSGSFTDSPTLGYHVYDVRWAKTVNKVTAVGQQRTLQVLNLRNQ